ncbi:MAG: RNA ligase (ATP) [Gemmatimonadales bacterium]|nr:RNA ligase (ATP) [Gemmatimonadales bacterium]
MSLFEVSVLPLSAVEPHPNADRLSLAVVGGFRAVIAKGSLAAGDTVAYFPTDSVFPADVAEALGVGGYLVGKEKNRVKAIRLRGVLSEGIVLPMQRVLEVLAARGITHAPGAEQWEDGLAEALGITKYEEPIPVGMAGRARPWPSFLPKYDVENIKRPEFAHALHPGEAVVVTEKRHGTNCAVALGPDLDPEEPAYVCSRGLALVESLDNLYWIAARRAGLIEKLSRLRDDLVAAGREVQNLSVHGEVLGCQDLRYGATMQEPRFEAFDLRLNGEWLSWGEFAAITERYDIPRVPTLYTGPFEYALLESLAEGVATGMGPEGHIREGVVVRPQVERHDPVLGRVQLKYVSAAYLTRAGGTEMR